MLDYAIVVATRNRLDALHDSVPLFLNQTRPPARLVIVDHSDDHAAVVTFLAEVAKATPIPIEVIHSDRGNAAHQRNLGLARVQEAVTMLPDDDTLWFPDTAERVMAVYERDTKGLIGGVSGIPTAISPLAASVLPPSAHRRSLKQRIFQLRKDLEAHFVPEPFELYGRLRITALSPAANRSGLDDLKFLETMAGWRMTYRTSILREYGFDALLGSRVGYALHEDKDLSTRAQQADHLIVAAPGARMMHDAYPGKRAGGFEYGMCWILNYLYICRKVFGNAPPGRAPVRRYLRYKTLLYRLRTADRHGRQVARGAAAAFAQFDRMWQAPDGQLAAVYDAIWDEALRAEQNRSG